MRVLKLSGGDLASRLAARQIREEAIGYLYSGQIVTFDLSEIESMSASYADELFAVLVEELGFEQFVRGVRLKRARQSVLITIAIAIRERTARGG
ncbi:MAG TPA: DUF4325 domain-containing protein [Anaerolineae bacterium]|nr:DUF4325 domain-containing protein [Anaerolineae bacterium]